MQCASRSMRARRSKRRSAALLIAGRVPTIAAGVQHAAAALDSGEAARVLQRVVRVSNEQREAAPS